MQHRHSSSRYTKMSSLSQAGGTIHTQMNLNVLFSDKVVGRHLIYRYLTIVQMNSPAKLQPLDVNKRRKET